LTWVDIIVAGYVIELTEWSGSLTKSPPKMILSMCSIKILSELDDICAGYYIKFVVKVTEDGVALLKHQGFATNEKQETTIKYLFYDYNDLTISDLKAVSIWCFMLLYLNFMKELSSVISMLYPDSVTEIYGWNVFRSS